MGLSGKGTDARELPRVTSIQVLRALAAAAVVIAHAQFDLTGRSVTESPLPNLGWLKAGVDVFFVVSGFVMVYGSESLFGSKKGPRVFLLRRLNRIAPLYWLMTTIYIGIALSDPAVRHKGYSAAMIAASYLFIPFRSPDGSMEPIVGQGWTLNYEMAFYVLFAVVIVAPRSIAVMLASGALIVGVLLGRVLPGTAPDAVSYWIDPIVLEFVFGMLLAVGYQKGLRLGRAIRWPLVAGAIIMIHAAYFSDLFAGPFRALYWGIPATMIVLGATFGVPSRPAAGQQWLSRLGDVSYALYLVHSLPIRALSILWVSLGLQFGVGAWLYLLVALCGSTGVAVALHCYVEESLNSACRHLLFAPKLQSTGA